MSSVLKDKYELLWFVGCEDGNPNGDPDMGNMPRVDPETGHGLITDVCVKHGAREYISLAKAGEPGMNLFVEPHVNLNRHIAEAREAAGCAPGDKSPAAIDKARQMVCDMFVDIRTYGGVLSTGPNAGQVRGAVNITMGRTVDPVMPIDMGITRCAFVENAKSDKATAADYLEMEKQMRGDKMQGMGRKPFVPFGLYKFRGFVSAGDAAKNGFTEEDFALTVESLANMHDVVRSASKGMMYLAGPIIIFRHTDAPLGCMAAQKLFEMCDCHRKDGILVPRTYRDYECILDVSRRHRQIDIGFFEPYAEDIVWNKLPDDEDWMKFVM